MNRKRYLLLGGLVLVLVLVLAVTAPGGVERYDGAQSSAPAWTAACWKERPRNDRRLLARCARVRGRVLWVRRQGRGVESKAEMMLSSHFGLVLAKMSPYLGRRIPGIGQYVRIVGPLVKSRAGLKEVQFFAQE